MKTLQQFLQDDRDRFLTKIKQDTQPAYIQSVCEEQLHRVLSQYNDQDISDERRTHAQYLLEIMKLSFPLLDTTSDIKIYSRTQYNKEQPVKNKKGSLLLAAACICAVVSAVLLVIFAGSILKITGVIVGLVFALAAMVLFYLAGRISRAKKEDAELFTEVQIDEKRIYRILDAQMMRCDHILDELDKVHKAPIQTVTNEQMDRAMIDYFAQVLESTAAENSELANEIRSNTDYYLHTQKITVVWDTKEHPEWFDTMPGKPFVLRPALVQEGKVLHRGLASGVK